MVNSIHTVQLTDAVSELDATATLAFLEGGKRAYAPEEVVREIWISDSLFSKYPDPKLPPKRLAFIEAVARGIDTLDAEEAARLRELAPLLDRIEDGYAKILTRTHACSGSKLPPLTQVSAALALAASQIEQLEEHARRSIGAGPEFRPAQNVQVEDRSINPDSEAYGLLKSATANLLMLAHTQKWFNAEGHVVLPGSLVSTSDQERQQVLEVLSFARAWLSWDRAQTRMRWDQVSAQALTAPFPKGVPAHIQDIIQTLPSGLVELTDFIANARLFARTNQHSVELMQHQMKPLASLSRQIKLPPVDVLSFEEALGSITVSEGYSFNIVADSKPYAGLSIAQWLRGYAVLVQLCREPPADADTKHSCPVLSEESLIKSLSLGGLPVDRAKTFIHHCCLSKSRNDMYDRPLIRVGEDRYLLASPSLKNALLGPIVMSAISGAGAQIKRKGNAFEKSIIKMLEDAGHHAVGVKGIRNKQEYEYDALWVWGDFCFLLECKNRSLSGGVLQLAHHAHRESLNYAAQVRRLVTGLLTHPDILDHKLPQARGKLLVPCVVNALPYAIPDGLDGVYFSDFSSLRRFFASGYIGETAFQRGREPVRTKEGQVFSTWSGAQPTPLDLLRQLQCPIQFYLAHQDTVIQPILTGLGPTDAVVIGEYLKNDFTVVTGRAAAKRYELDYPLKSVAEWETLLPRIP